MNTFGGCNATINSSALDFPILVFASGSEIIVHDLNSGAVCGVLSGHKEYVNCVKIPQHGLILSGGADKRVLLWENLSVVQELSVQSSVINICSDDSHVVILTTDGSVSVCSYSLSVLSTLDFSSSLQEGCALSTVYDQKLLALGGSDVKVHIYQVGTSLKYANSLEGHTKTIRCLSFHPSKPLLVSCGQDGYIRIWKIFDYTPVSFFELEGTSVLYDTGLSAKAEAVLLGHSSAITAARWTDGRLVTFSHDFTVQLWQEGEGEAWLQAAAMGQMKGNKNIFCGGVTASHIIIANAYTGGFYIWKEVNEDWEAVEAPSGHTGIVTDVALTEHFALTCSLDQTTRLWAVGNPSWQELSRPMVHGYDMNAIAFTGNFLVSGGDEKVLRVFQVSAVTADILKNKTGTNIEGAHAGGAQTLGLMTKTTDQVIQVSEKVTEDYLCGQTLWPEQFKLYGHGYEVCLLTAKHNSSIVASACKAQSAEHAFIIVWDLDKRAEVTRLHYHSLTVTDMAFSDDDRYLLTVSRDRHWALFDNLELVGGKEAHARVIYGCAWNSDSSRFITASRDRRLKLWGLDGTLLKTILLVSPLTACCFVGEHKIALGLENGSLFKVNSETEEKVQIGTHGKSVNKLKWKDGNLFSVGNHSLRITPLNI